MSWCPECLIHEVDPSNHRGTCPVCIDKARLAADARLTTMLHQLHHPPTTKEGA